MRSGWIRSDMDRVRPFGAVRSWSGRCCGGSRGRDELTTVAIQIGAEVLDHRHQWLRQIKNRRGLVVGSGLSATDDIGLHGRIERRDGCCANGVPGQRTGRCFLDIIGKLINCWWPSPLRIHFWTSSRMMAKSPTSKNAEERIALAGQALSPG